MGYNEFILGVNVVSVVILLMMGLLLCFAARFKGESSYAVLITVLTTVPIYIYNICRSLGWYDMAIFLAPFGYSANLALMPLLYLLVHRGFNPFYRFTLVRLLHFIPAFLLFAIIGIYLFLLPANEYPHFIAIEDIGRGSWVNNVNYLILLIQLVCYLFVVFRYLRRVKHISATITPIRNCCARCGFLDSYCSLLCYLSWLWQVMLFGHEPMLG